MNRGYFSPGVALSLGLSFIPERIGSWEVGVKGQGILLGSNTEWADSGGDTRSADFILTTGVGMSYSRATRITSISLMQGKGKTKPPTV